MDWLSNALSFVVGAAASFAVGVPNVVVDSLLKQPRLSVSVADDLGEALNSKCVGASVTNLSRKFLRVERNVARNVSLLYKVSAADTGEHLTWFRGFWDGSKNQVDIGCGAKKSMIVATKAKGDEECSLVGDYPCKLKCGDYLIEWELFRESIPISCGNLLLSNKSTNLDDFTLTLVPVKKQLKAVADVNSAVSRGRSYVSEYLTVEGMAYLLGAGVLFDTLKEATWVVYIIAVIGLMFVYGGLIGRPSRFVKWEARAAVIWSAIPIGLFIMEYARILPTALEQSRSPWFATPWSYAGPLVIVALLSKAIVEVYRRRVRKTRSP